MWPVKYDRTHQAVKTCRDLGNTVFELLFPWPSLSFELVDELLNHSRLFLHSGQRKRRSSLSLRGGRCATCPRSSQFFGKQGPTTRSPFELRGAITWVLLRRAERSGASASHLFRFCLSSACVALRQPWLILVISSFARDCFTPAHFSPYSICDYAASEELHNILVGPEKNWCCSLTTPQLH